MRTSVTVAEALALVLAEAEALASETLPAGEALGRVLTEAVASERTLPPADNSAMDGYAVRAVDLVGAAPDRPVELRVLGEVPAGGAADRAVEKGCALRIFTGAPIPPGADAVVRQEDTEADAGQVSITVEVQVGSHIRPAGEDVKSGEQVLDAGRRIGPAELGMLASLGRSMVAVHQRPRVALLSGGDELVEPDGDIQGGRIVSSNSYSLAAQCRGVGAHPVYLGIAGDRPEELAQRFRAGLTADVLISSAGVSVGDHDHVRPVLEKLGCRSIFWGVEMKPGFPLFFGRFETGGPLVFGLPGNPVSAMVTFEQFVRPVLRKLCGHRTWFRATVEARLTTSLTKPAGRLHFVRVALERRRGEALATPLGNQSSGVLRSMIEAQGLLIFPREETRLEEGEAARVQILDEDFLISSDTPS